MSSSVLDYAVLKALASAGEATEDQLSAELGEDLDSVVFALLRLARRGLVQKSLGHAIDYPCWEPTGAGFALAHSGAPTLGAALSLLFSPAGGDNRVDSARDPSSPGLLQPRIPRSFVP